MTERRLVERCLQGDRDAQRDLYAQTCERIHRLLLKMTHNPSDAADLTQATYIRVFATLDRFDGESRLTTWIYRIAVNEALQYLRSDRRRVSREQAAARTHVDLAWSSNHDDRLDVRHAMERLTADERMLIVLRYFEGHSYAEMADLLDKPSGTIGSELNRVRAKLQEILAPKPVTDSARNPVSAASNPIEGAATLGGARSSDYEQPSKSTKRR